MFKLNKKAEEVFKSPFGAEIYSRILRTVERYHMDVALEKGTLLGFSGGADSVMLLLFLLEYRRKENKNFKILCAHVNHCIRGSEADSDETFSFNTVNDSSAEFISTHIDVPSLASKIGIGIEETARNARYSFFNEIISSRNDIDSISIAHNSTDNVETVVFNMLRGTGLSGMCGIKPLRDNIVRPLIGISKREICSLLDAFAVPYVTDSTNLSSDYTRNYIRNEILPLFEHISSNPELAVTRMTENLLEDFRYIEKCADDFIFSNVIDGTCDTGALSELPHSLFARVISKLIYAKCGIYPEEKHISTLKQLLKKDNFCFSLPGKYNFSSQRGKCLFVNKSDKNPLDSMIFPLSFGENIIEGTNLVIHIGEVDKTSLNVYNFSIQARISSDIIKGGVHVRVKQDGDAYKYSGITHKLKKVFNDRNIPPFEREYIPIISDDNGILWVPGLSVRDGSHSADDNNVTVTVCYKNAQSNDIRMYTALKRV